MHPTPGGFGQSAALGLLAGSRHRSPPQLNLSPPTVLLRRYRKGRLSLPPPPLSPERLASTTTNLNTVTTTVS
ncbi:MAG: hypothetical protein HC878_16030 [Leptolyngbyaceae cyanobacterium SL_5_14]|nr:hypothetical protein [Leptolyngbyaceae cyanobacterium SL_5_14]